MRPIFVAAISASICSNINAATNVCAVMQKWFFCTLRTVLIHIHFSKNCFMAFVHQFLPDGNHVYTVHSLTASVSCANVKRANFLHTLILLYEIRNPTLTQIDFMRIISFVCLFVRRTREKDEASANQLTENDNSMNIAIFNELLVSFRSPATPVCQTWP